MNLPGLKNKMRGAGGFLPRLMDSPPHLNSPKDNNDHASASIQTIHAASVRKTN